MDLIRNKKINTELLVSERIELAQLPEHIETSKHSRSASKTIIVNDGLDAIVKSYQRRSS